MPITGGEFYHFVKPQNPYLMIIQRETNWLFVGVEALNKHLASRHMMEKARERVIQRETNWLFVGVEALNKHLASRQMIEKARERKMPPDPFCLRFIRPFSWLLRTVMLVGIKILRSCLVPMRRSVKVVWRENRERKGLWLAKRTAPYQSR